MKTPSMIVKSAQNGLKTPKDLLKGLPTVVTPPSKPSAPSIPKIQQFKVEIPKPAAIKNVVTTSPKNFGSSPLTYAKAPPVKLAEDDAILSINNLIKESEDSEDQETLKKCVEEGLYIPVEPENFEKEAYVSDSKIVVQSQKEKDVELWRAYKAAPSSVTLAPLMRAVQPIINSEVNRWAGNVPRPVLEMEAKKLALDALKTYDPDKGTALATHVHNRLYKLSRTVYSNQDIVRMPENKKLKSQTFYNATELLKGELGRDPNVTEIADHLGWSSKTVKDVQRSMIGEYVESQDEGASGFDVDPGSDSTIDFVYHSLNPSDQKIFELTTGYGGHRPQTAQQIAAKVGMNQNQVAYRRKLIAQQIEKANSIR